MHQSPRRRGFEELKKVPKSSYRSLDTFESQKVLRYLFLPIYLCNDQVRFITIGGIDDVDHVKLRT